MNRAWKQKSENNKSIRLQQLETHISQISVKLQELLKKHAALMKLNAQQKEVITALEKKQEENDKKIKKLEEQQYILKSAAGNLTDVDKKAFEQTISKYIREIDKCIALLSD